MNKYFPRWFVFYVIATSILLSCKDDNVQMPELTHVSFVDYPDIPINISTDSIPTTFANTTKLPLNAGTDAPIKIKLEVESFQSAEVYVAGSHMIESFDTDVISLDYKPLYFIRINSPSGINKVYALQMTREEPTAPEILSVDIDLDPTGRSPLAGVVNVTSNQEVKLSYIVKGQDGEDFTMETANFATSNEITLYGLYADYSNLVSVTVTSQAGVTSTKEFFVKTQPLPATLPQPSEITINKADLVKSTSKLVMFFPMRTSGTGNDAGEYYPIGVDRFGKIRWYLKVAMDNNTVMKKLQNGHWMFPLQGSFTEVDLLGTTYSTMPLEYNMHHDFVELPNGDILYLADNPSLHNTVEDQIYRVSRDGTIKDMIDLYTLLQPDRPRLPSIPLATDWFHANSIYYDASDNSVIVSGRHQSAVVKIDLNTKAIKWILSDPTYWNEDLTALLLTPSGENFTQQWGQHSVILNPDDPSRLLLFDNGNWRSYTEPLAPADSYTRLVEFKVDGSTVTQQFEFGREYGSQLFAPYLGTVGFIGTSGYFICYGGIYKDGAGNAMDLFDPALGHNLVRFMEINTQGEVYLDISIEKTPPKDGHGIRSYRAFPFSFN